MTAARPLPWDDSSIRFTADLRTVSEMNARENRWKVGKRKKAQRERIHALMLVHMHACRPKPPYRISMVRIAPRKLDTDNLTMSFKWIRDQVAKSLGISDGPDTGHEWVPPTQRKPRPREVGLQAGGYGVEIRIEAR